MMTEMVSVCRRSHIELRSITVNNTTAYRSRLRPCARVAARVVESVTIESEDCDV